MDISGSSFLAPIAEYTNNPFRAMCLGAGAGFAFVPLVSVIAVCRSEGRLSHIDLSKSESKKAGIQLFGKEPKDFGPAMDRITDEFPYASRFDLNCGCPAPNVTESGGGSALLEKPSAIENIVSEMRSRAAVVSVKIRILKSWENTLAACKAVEKGGADFLIVHGRTPEQGYSGKADWETIRKIKESISIPVVGNGDITSIGQGRALVEGGYCDAFMVGRAAMSNPYIFSEKEPRGFAERRAMLADYIRLCGNPGASGMMDIRSKALFFLRGFPGSAEMRNAVSRIRDTEELLGLLDSY